jgi:hypothetical protein
MILEVSACGVPGMNVPVLDVGLSPTKGGPGRSVWSGVHGESGVGGGGSRGADRRDVVAAHLGSRGTGR